MTISDWIGGWVGLWLEEAYPAYAQMPISEALPAWSLEDLWATPQKAAGTCPEEGEPRAPGRPRGSAAVSGVPLTLDGRRCLEEVARGAIARLATYVEDAHAGRWGAAAPEAGGAQVRMYIGQLAGYPVAASMVSVILPGDETALGNLQKMLLAADNPNIESREVIARCAATTLVGPRGAGDFADVSVLRQKSNAQLGGMIPSRVMEDIITSYVRVPRDTGDFYVSACISTRSPPATEVLYYLPELDCGSCVLSLNHTSGSVVEVLGPGRLRLSFVAHNEAAGCVPRWANELGVQQAARAQLQRLMEAALAPPEAPARR